MANIIDAQELKKLLNEQVRLEMKQIIAEEAEKAAREVERRVNAGADRIALRLMSEYSVERHGTEIVIRVQKLQEPSDA